jgi:DNA-binding transcriptional ArsR family regulator
VTEVRTDEAARALAHPVRVAILKALGQDSRSAVSVSREIGQPLSNVAYHFRVLRELGALEETGSRPARGAMEHFYRAAWQVRVEVEPVK